MKITKTDLISKVAKASKYTKKDISVALTSTFDVIAEILKNGDSVVIPGFGTFDARVSKAREMANPLTGGITKVEEHLVPRFTASDILKNLVREGA